MPQTPPSRTLKDFQVDTVEYVLRRLYDDPDPTDRFLVADEVGMGKTLVARGVIEWLQSSGFSTMTPSTASTSSTSAPTQTSLGRTSPSSTCAATAPSHCRRGSLCCATQLRDLNRRMPDGSKTVNLVAFTPGTSFDKGQRGGRVEERALLSWLLRAADGRHARGTATRSRRILRMEVNESTVGLRICGRLNDPDGRSRRVRREEVPRLLSVGSLSCLNLADLVDEMRGRSRVNTEQWYRRDSPSSARFAACSPTSASTASSRTSSSSTSSSVSSICSNGRKRTPSAR